MRTSLINMETITMKNLKFSVIALVLLLAGCSTTSVVYDDIYYSRQDRKLSDNKSIASANQAAQPTTASSNLQYDYQNYYQEDVAGTVQTQAASPVYSTTETVVEPDGTTYTTTETYYNSEYAMRMRRFGSGASSSFGYYDNFNTGCFGCYGNSFSMSYSPMGWGWGSSFSYGWPYYNYSPFWGYYDPFFYDPWYSWGGYWPSSYRWGYGGYWSGYRHGYYNGFWDGYYYGGGYVGRPVDSRPGTLYGHRGTYGGGSTIASGSPRGGSAANTTNTVGAARGSRSAEADYNNPTKTTSVSERGSPSSARERQPNDAVQGAVRAERPSAAERSAAQEVGVRERPVQTGQAARPTAQERIGEYRERYDRPAAQPRYERPKSYTSPSARQPKSSNEYVRPQAEPNRANPATRESGAVRVEPNRQSPSNNSRQVSPTPTAPTRTMVRPQPAPARSSGTPSVSQPSRSSGSSSGGSSPSWNSGGSNSSSGSSRSSGSTISPSSSGNSSSSGTSSSGSSSSGSSRGSSSSNSSSSGNRR
jgi:hypothetical protein